MTFMVKKVLTKIALLAGVLLIANAIFLTAATNVNVGTAFVFIVGAAFTAYGIWYKKIAELTSRGFMRILKYAAVAALIFELCLIVFIACEGQRDSVNYSEDAVIVLGAAVHGDQVSRSLAHRLDKAVEYAEKNQTAIIVVSGGQGAQEDVTEASAMEKYLIAEGIAKERIIKEERSTSTHENFKFSRKLLDSHFHGTYTCAYITNDYHLYRAGSIAELAGVEAEGAGAYTDWYNVPSSYLRESLAVIKFWILKR